VQGLS
jgi:hypothetical protein